MGSREFSGLPRDLLISVYGLEEEAAPDHQDGSRYRQLSEWVACFIESESANYDPAWGKAATMLLDEKAVQVHGEYGCALLITQSLIAAAREPRCHVQVLGLDGWEYHVHCSQASRYEWTSSSKGYAVLQAGSFPVSLLSKFNSDFNAALDKAKQRKAEQRSAASNAQGHQKTPAFVWAVVTDVLRGMGAAASHGVPQQPPGAFTDVGLHTGGRPRNTSWPLVQFVLEELVWQQGGEFERVSF